MEQSTVSLGPQLPLLVIPKHCTTLDTNYKVTDNVLLDVNITSKDTEGNETCVYNGLCNVKLIDNFEVDIQISKCPHQEDPIEIDIETDNVPIVINDVGQLSNGYSVYNQNQVWIDPSRSPYVYNYYDMDSHDYAVNNVHHTQTNHITVEQHNTYITQNVFKYKNSFHCSPEKEYEPPRRIRQVNSIDEHKNSDLNISTSYEDDEFACGVFLSQLQDEIINEKITKAREERKYIDLHSDNEALNQLMSSGIQSMSKQRKTILFLGHDSHCGQTIQKIAVNDPTLKCVGYVDAEDESSNETFIVNNPLQKKYQCDKCKQIFDQIAAFKQHMVGNHKGPKAHESEIINDVKYMCEDCGKTLKTQKKFELHCQGHGDPDLECSKCHKVFASKFTLRTHRKIHDRKFHCVYCSKTYVNADQLTDHTQKVHHIFICEICGHFASKSRDFIAHMKSHEVAIENEEFVDSLIDDGIIESEILSGTPNHKSDHLDADALATRDRIVLPMSRDDVVENANDVIAKVMSNKVFLLHSKKARKHKKYTKICDVCQKKFDRVGDLKRHLIEHVIRSTLAKTPVSKHGTLDIQCEVCKQETFNKIDKYKAHLREHAKLTIYKCTFCDKSFSDSSNFSKHKKIHGHSFFQCDLCQRKFNSKKMIAQHMEYHSKHLPLNCLYCDKIFHFKSKLNKHIKYSHTKEITTKFRCRFCPDFFRSLKEKWDHEWHIHSVRNYVIDCMVCGSKFRKYTELKRHCIDFHNIDIPSAKNIWKSDK